MSCRPPRKNNIGERFSSPIQPYRHAADSLDFRARRRSSGVHDIIFVDDRSRQARPPPGTGPASPEGRDAAPAGRRATEADHQSGRQERRCRQDVPDETAGKVLERPGQALGQQVCQPQERQTVVAIILVISN